MSYFWVNKQNRYQLKDGRWLPTPAGMLENYIWAPLHGKDGRTQHHWKTLNEIQPGDVLFISVDAYITAVAKAEKLAAIEFPPNEPKAWEGKGYKVQVRYEQLKNKIKISDFYDEIKRHLPSKYSPFDRDGRKNQGCCYRLDELSGEYLQSLVAKELSKIQIQEFRDLPQDPYSLDEFQPNNLEDARKITVKAIKQREGQPKFRRDLLEIYERRCAVSGSRAESVLEAAHIMPYKGIETNNLSNGLILRADIHTLFDKGLMKISPINYSISVDGILKGTEHEQFHGNVIRMPKSNPPSKEALKFREDFFCA